MDFIRLGCFVQHYGGATLDASLLMMTLVGFLPPRDPKLTGTIEAISRELTVDGFVALAVRNDVGLLSERYDPIGRRQLGNFPQALSHVGLVNTALNLSRPRGPAQERSGA